MHNYWSLKESLLCVLIFILAEFTIAFLLLGVSAVFSLNIPETLFFGFFTLCTTIFLIYPGWYFLKKRQGNMGIALGVQRPKHMGKFFLTLLGAYALYLFAMSFIGYLSITHGIEIPGFSEQEPLPFAPLENWYIGLMSFISIALLAPIGEEILFRGILLPTFLRTWGPKRASLLTALLFATIHFQWETIAPLFLLGLILNALYLSERNLWYPIAFHGLNNGIALLVMHLVHTG